NRRLTGTYPALLHQSTSVELGEAARRLVCRGPCLFRRRSGFVSFALCRRGARLELPHLQLESAELLAASLLRAPGSCELVARGGGPPRRQPGERLEPGRLELFGEPAFAKPLSALG